MGSEMCIRDSAMAAQQNVYGALSGGPMAILAGAAAVIIGFALVPALSRIGQKKSDAEAASSLTKAPR